MSGNRYTGLPSYDARDTAGYGRLNPSGFNQQRSFEQYPTPPTEDPEAEEEIDTDTMSAVMSRILKYLPGDPYAKNKVDPYHYVDGASPISMHERLSTSKGMVPFPKMYQGRTQSGFGGAGAALPYGTAFPGFRTTIEPTGTKKGWSQPPYPMPEFEDLEEPAYNLADILDRNPDEEHLDDVKELVKLIHWEQGKD